MPFTAAQVIATTGAKEALYLAMQALCDRRRRGLLPAPYWVTYAEQAKLAGADGRPDRDARAGLEADARRLARST